MRVSIDIALPKGRLGEQVYDMFERAGCGGPGINRCTVAGMIMCCDANRRFTSNSCCVIALAVV